MTARHFADGHRARSFKPLASKNSFLFYVFAEGEARLRGLSVESVADSAYRLDNVGA
jgi:hypothetical protein